VIELKAAQIASSLGIILPKAVLSQLNVGEGDSLFLMPCDDGYQLLALNPEVAFQIERAEDITKRYRNTLDKLAD